MAELEQGMTSPKPAPDAELAYAFDVPFIWHDTRQGRERLGQSREVVPVRIRGVHPGTFSRIDAPNGFEGASMVVDAHDDMWNAYRGNPLERGDDAPTPWMFDNPVPGGLIPWRTKERATLEMRAKAIDYPYEAAAARVLRITEADVVHDGSHIYRRVKSRDPAAAYSEGELGPVKKLCLEALEGGERALRVNPKCVDVIEKLATLRRITLSAHLDLVGPDLAPRLRAVLGETADTLSLLHPDERGRRRMARIAEAVGYERPKGEDDKILMGLSFR